MDRRLLLVSTSFIAYSVAAQPALAQEAPAQASADSQALQEVIVTAERRFNTAQKTAASISVRTGDDMQAQGRYELKNILEDVPGLTGGAAGTVATALVGGTDNPASGLVIRGVQSNAGAGGSVTSTAAAAAIYVDDVYGGIGGGYDIDRVEVLRGPQGTLYGRSATAGVVAIHTEDPSTARLGGEGAVEFGNYSLRHYTGGVNLPLIQDKLAVRLSGNLYDRDGYYSAVGGAISSKDFRAKALWTPTDKLSLLVGYAQEDNKTRSGGISVTHGSSPDNFVFTPQEVAPPGKSDFRQYWANLTVDLGAVAITYIPAYRTWKQQSTVYLRSLFLNADQKVSTPSDTFLTHELRIRSNDGGSSLQWQAGFLHYQNALSDSNNLFIIPNGPYAFKSNTHKTTSADGAFAEATYSAAPGTRVTAGLRYDHTQIRNIGDYTSIIGLTQTLTGDQGLRTFDNITYKARLEHDLTPRNLVYGAISTGFSPGDVTQTTDATFNPVVQVLKAETLTAYELGSKNRFLDNHLQVNGDVFYYDYGGFQTAGLNTSPQTPGTPTFNTVSSPMKSFGAELEVESRPWVNGTISFNASYTHARYGGFGQYAFLFAKSEVPGVAPLQGVLAYDHRFPLGKATLVLHGDVRYFSAHDTSAITQDWAALGVEPFVRVSSQAIGDLNASLLFEPNLSITAYVRNVADTRFIPDGWGVAGAIQPPGGPLILSENSPGLSDPRTFGVVLGFKF